MGLLKGSLTPHERARLVELQDMLIERFVAHKVAVTDGRQGRIKELESEIDKILREKAEIEKWAVLGSA